MFNCLTQNMAERRARSRSSPKHAIFYFTKYLHSNPPWLFAKFKARAAIPHLKVFRSRLRMIFIPHPGHKFWTLKLVNNGGWFMMRGDSMRTTGRTWTWEVDFGRIEKKLLSRIAFLAIFLSGFEPNSIHSNVILVTFHLPKTAQTSTRIFRRNVV